MPVIHHAAPTAATHATAVHAAAQPGRAQASSVKGEAHARPAPEKKPARTVRVVRIRAGDSVYSIARAQHSSVAAILKENPKVDVRRLVPGTSLRVPVPTKASAPATSKPGKPAAPATQKPGKATPAKPSKQAPPRSTGRPTYAPKPTRVITYAGTAAAKRYPAAAVASGDRHRRQLAGADLPDRPEIRAMIVSTAKRYGVDPALALAIGWQESGHRQSAVSVCDAIGTMQVMPGTGRWAASLAGQKLDLMRAQDNITAGVITLRYLTQHAADRDQAIAAYYQGLGAVRAHGLYPDTKRYVASVKAHMKRFAA